MLQLSQKSKYALSLLSFLAAQDQCVLSPIKKISTQTYLPYRFLSQIAVELKHAGIIDAKEGKGGGYFLKKSLEKVSLKEMIEAVDGVVGLVDCQTNTYCGNQSSCKNKSKWDVVRNEVAGVLGKYMVSDVL